MPALPCTTCDIPVCEYHTQPILLPFPNPPERIPHPWPWPDEHWRTYIVCPSCGQVLQRRKQHIQWAEHDAKAVVAHLSSKAWFCMAFDCAMTECGMQVQLYLEMPASSSSVDILNKVQSRTTRGNMVCGHLVSIAAPWGIFRVIGPIPAYSLIGLDSDHDPVSPLPQTRDLSSILQIMTLSARNQLLGTVEDIQLGTVMAHVTVRVGNNLVESVITRRSAEEMKLKKGDTVKAVIKSTEVMLLKD
jgi:molybdopterin-binding protein